MAQIAPFCGVRYNPQTVDDVGKVIAPPYDVIKTDERMTLENRHPNNIVRLILSQPDDNDTETDNQYTRAAERLKDWISTEVLAGR